ncbi:energy-coupling factor transporter transmembrane component T family protein [Anaerovorax odorimutans]|uniref:energy-coupling factor transporter transmembrane component T family protein n=1 Tax=Anaerovorax odorimutans TaxID=109327 RepID=UPI0004011046|nr:energy-coupling factor transporter transmembrane component T [Anaerovorax odorimutans]
MKLDPRTKMVIAVCISSLAVIYNTPDKLFFLLLLTMLLLLVFRINLKSVWGSLKPFLFMVFSLFFIQCVFIRSGSSLLTIGNVTILTSGGLLQGVGVALRIMILVAVVLLLTTFSSREFILGLTQCKLPYELVFMVSLAIRFLPLFRDEAVNTFTALQLRGVELKKIKWGRKIEIYIHLLLPLIYGVLIKARQMAVSMESRGFRVYPKRTYMKKLILSSLDISVMLLSFSVTLILIVIYIKESF